MTRLLITHTLVLVACDLASTREPLTLRAHDLAAVVDDRGARVELPSGTTRVRVRGFGRASSDAPVGPARVERRGDYVTRAIDGTSWEWWRATGAGLQHGVTFNERPRGSGALTVDVAFDGLEPRSVSSTAVSLHDRRGERVATYAGLVVLDARGRVIPARLGARNDGVAVEIDDRDAVYPLVVDPILSSEHPLASTREAGDKFGSSVAIAEDGSRVVVGAPEDDTAAGGAAGSALVYTLGASDYSLEATLFAGDAVAGDLFGDAVAISRDGSRALAGVSGDGPSVMGSARVLLRTGTTWAEEATLSPAGARANDSFGASVALAADGTRAFVGSGLADGTHVDAGAVRVFVRAGAAWTEEATLTAPDAAPSDGFGESIAASADGSRALVGAPFDDVGGTMNAGSARVFVRAGATWAEEAVLSPAGGSPNDNAGNSVALSADGTVAVVGVYHDDTGVGSNAGTARVFVRAGTTWTEAATLAARTPQREALLGSAVSISANGSRVVAGAPQEDGAGLDTNAGSVHVFVRGATSWTDEGTIFTDAMPGTRTDDFFGLSVALSGDGTRAAVGSPLEGALRGTSRVLVLSASDGTACTAGLECASGFCVDGVCCATACAGGSGDCQACSTAAGGTTNGTCTPLSAAAAPLVTCRARSGECDVAETCSSASTTCPANAFAPVTRTCRAAGGACDSAETCTGTSGACPPDAFLDSATTCRASAGACDVAETCSGASAACPANSFASATRTCRAAAGACDAAETCTGAAASCPADGFLGASTTCRAASGVCDAAEACTGASADCPPNAFAPATRLCRDAGGACDVAETCTGTSDVCPPNAFQTPGTVCRRSAGPCDAAETCGGASASCPTDGFVAGVVCRPSISTCDVAESCAGTSAACPADAATAEGSVCMEASGECDEPDTCAGRVGATAACTARFRPAGVRCRSATCTEGVEAHAATCSGLSASCPAPATTDCHPFLCGADACLTECSLDAECAAGFVCTGGACVTPPGVDAGVRDAGPPVLTRDAGASDDAGGVSDAATPPDAGARDRDAGVESPPRDGGCACSASSRDGDAIAFFALGATAILYLGRRARRPATRARRDRASSQRR